MLRRDRTAAVMKYVAKATRRRRRISQARFFFMYTMSQVQICACTRIGIWQMYIIELLSEMVYKAYETGGRQSAGSAWNEAARSDI